MYSPETVLAVDLETTGLDPLVDRVVSFALVRVSRDGDTYPVMSSIVDPGMTIPAESVAVHGISDEMARREGIAHSVAMNECGAAIRHAWAIGEPVCAYNAAYDLTIIDRTCSAGLGSGGVVIDPLLLSRILDPGCRHTLAEVAARHGVVLGHAHNAEDDAAAAGLLAFVLSGRLHGVVASEDDLMLMQSRAAAEFRHSRGGVEGWPMATSSIGIGVTADH